MKKLIRLILIFMTILLIQESKTEKVHAQELVTPSGITVEDLEEKVDEFMKDNLGKQAPGASVGVVKNGEIIFLKGYGLADLENNIKVEADTVFEYGSISKLFVWTSAMQLVEEGKLDLDQDIRSYLSEDFNKKWKTKYPVTMRNIMNHSSGFGEYPFDIISLEEIEEMSLEDAILFNHPQQYFKPGTASAYSNYATSLAALVVESITGEKFYKYEQDHIFKELKMSNVAGNMLWNDNPNILEKKAQGYRGMDNEFKKLGWSYIPLYPAGSVNGTAEDLCKFGVSLMDGESSILKEGTISKILEESFEESFSGTHHGFFKYDSKTGQAFGHGGNTAGFSAQFVFVPEEEFALVVLTNGAGEMTMTMGLQDLLIGNSMDQATETISKEKMTDPSKFEGSYVTMRRSMGTPLEFISYLGLGKIEKTGEDKVTYSVHGFTGEYIQVGENEFKIIKSSSPIFNVIYPSLKFKENDNGTYKILVGNGQDFDESQGIRSFPMLLGNLLTIIISSIFYLVINILNLVKFRKKEGQLNKLQIRLNLKGLIISIGWIIILVSIMSNPFISYNQMAIYQFAILALTILSLIDIFLGVRRWRIDENKNNKILFVVSSIIFISLINLLAIWNFYNFSPLFS